MFEKDRESPIIPENKGNIILRKIRTLILKKLSLEKVENDPEMSEKILNDINKENACGLFGLALKVIALKVMIH